jgi:hypothetical protein
VRMRFLKLHSSIASNADFSSMNATRSVFMLDTIITVKKSDQSAPFVPIFVY